MKPPDYGADQELNERLSRIEADISKIQALQRQAFSEDQARHHRVDKLLKTAADDRKLAMRYIGGIAGGVFVLVASNFKLPSTEELFWIGAVLAVALLFALLFFIVRMASRFNRERDARRHAEMRRRLGYGDDGATKT